MDSSQSQNALKQPSPFAFTGHEDAASLLASDPTALSLINDCTRRIASAATGASQSQVDADTKHIFAVGLAALDVFLQANVTGPIVSRHHTSTVEAHFTDAWKAAAPKDDSDSAPKQTPLVRLRRAALKHLQVDGNSPYPHIPLIELFCLARHVFVDALANKGESDSIELPAGNEGSTSKFSLAWMRLRVHSWHYKLIMEPSLGGSNFNKSSQWSDIPSLATIIQNGLQDVRAYVMGDDVWAQSEGWALQDQVQFLVEAANTYILLGRAETARELLQEATKMNRFDYALSGALGKRTKFQEKSTSQLVVLAASADENRAADASAGGDDEEDEEDEKPQALKLNDDTLLEEIHFTKEQNGGHAPSSELPPALASLAPDNQPQLNPLDQIILLSEATLKDAFSPTDTLTAEEILPFAVRVLADKSTNWQTYTQALLVRSRIEVHRSRTIERGILQMQAVADQVMTDTTYAATDAPGPQKVDEDETAVPSIQVSAPGQDAAAPAPTPTSFLPAPKPSESAPGEVRLRYIHALSTPPRWHLETELAYAWAGAGSIVSALEIFKRLRLWAEVALCLASVAAIDDAEGRGSGGEEKAKAIVRWQLLHATGADASSSSDPDDDLGDEDATNLKAANFAGPERHPPPPNAARLWCILGDMEDEPAHYERAWEVSQHRYARAQRSLAEYYLRQKELIKAQEAYKKATAVNRLNPEMWGRLGDISLRLARFEDAAEAYSRSIGSANGEAGGEDAKTWSNLGSALYSLYCEVSAAKKENSVDEDSSKPSTKLDDEEEDTETPTSGGRDTEQVVPHEPAKLIAQALSAYKKGASIAHDNWRIWENVITLAARMQPPAVGELLMAMRQVIRIRQSEDAVNADILAVLIKREVLTKSKVPGAASSDGIYEPPRGSLERAITLIIEEQIVPLITRRSELWSLVSKLRAWRGDYSGAVDASEKAWRAAIGSSGGGLLAGDSTSSARDWTSDEAAWADVVSYTDELVSALENWGESVETIGARWRSKARSAIRSVMGKGRTSWEDSDGWNVLENLMEGLKVDN